MLEKIKSNWLPNSLLAYQLQIMLRPAVLFFMSVIWVKCGLTAADIGQLEYALLITSGLSFFWIGGIFNVFQASYQQAKMQDKPKYVFRTAVQIWVHSLIATVIVYTLGVLGMWGNELHDLFGLTIILTFVQPFGWFADAFFLAQRNARLQWQTATIFNALLIIGISIIAIYKPTAKVIFGFYSTIISIKCLYAAWVIHKNAMQDWNWKNYKYDLKNSLPLTGSMLLGGLGSYFNPIFVAQNAGMAMLAIFRYGSRDFPLVQIPAGALSTYAGGIIDPKNPNEGLEALKAKSRTYQMWLLPCFSILLAFAPFLYTHFYSITFKESALIFGIFLFLGPIKLFFPQSVLTAMHAHKAQLFVSAIELIIHIGLVYWWYPIGGLVGVSFATIAAFLLEKLMLVIWLKYRYGINPNQYHSFHKLGLPYASLLLAWLAFYLFYKNI